MGENLKKESTGQYRLSLVDFFFFSGILLAPITPSYSRTHILSRIISFTFQDRLTLHCSLKYPGCNRNFSSKFLLFSDPLIQKSEEEIILKREFFVCGIMSTVITEMASSKNTYCQKYIHLITSTFIKYHKIRYSVWYHNQASQFSWLFQLDILRKYTCHQELCLRAQLQESVQNI